MYLPRWSQFLPSLRFRTRLALVLFLTLAITSAILFATYMGQNDRTKAYVAGVTSDLLAISQLTQAEIPPKVSRTEALEAYMQALKSAGLASITVASPSGEVVASTNPHQVGKKIKLKRRRRVIRPNPIHISADFPEVDVDAAIREKTYFVEFPIIQGEKASGGKVIGYVRIRGLGDQVDALLRRTYLVRSVWILVTVLAGIFAVVYLAFLFTKPIDMLVEGAKQVAQGNLYVSLPIERRDEIGRLAQTFNQMVGRLREARLLQERLSEAEKLSLLGRFAGSVAHEVRNSLNFINLSIDQIRAKHVSLVAGGAAAGDGRAAREFQRNLSNVKEEISRLNRLVNEFLSAGRQAPPSFSRCDLTESLTESVALVEKQAHAHDVIIGTEIPAGFPAIRADQQQMKTCFVNLLTNAIQAMPRGGKIHVSARHIPANGQPGKLQLRFADTGPGIPPADRERVFAPFFSTKATGFGLGLAITRKIVEDHGGAIYVRDDRMPGTIMVIELPLGADRTAAAESPVSQATTT
ncbi:MAG: ATP-binding protein [Terriglobia bacterium]